MHPLSLLAFPLLLATAQAIAATSCVDACKVLLDEGRMLSLQGQKQQAYEKFREASAAAPEATVPLLASATLLLDLSWQSSEPQASKLSDSAAAMAREALRLAPADTLAQDVLRQIEEGKPVMLHQPLIAAAQAWHQAETLYAQRRFDQARAQYEVAMAQDPLWSQVVVGAGDCYYAQQDWPRAEALFLRATVMEPRDRQAWRYLSDSLAQQGKLDAAEQALYGAIAANPSDRNNWAKLASLRGKRHAPLTSLHLQRGSSVTVGADGRYTINIDQRDLGKNSTPENAFALSLALVEAGLRNDQAKAGMSSWDIERAAWHRALQINDETIAKGGAGVRDPALLKMQEVVRDGQLDAALLILQYKPAYRAALDTWLGAHPDGIRTFIDRYSVQP